MPQRAYRCLGAVPASSAQPYAAKAELYFGCEVEEDLPRRLGQRLSIGGNRPL